MMETITMTGALWALAGGVLIGLSSTALLLASGRVAGIAGIAGGLTARDGDGSGWRIAFLAGLACGGVVLLFSDPEAFGPTPLRSPGQVALAGLLVGIGSRLGSGCTSGHGVCGLSRRSGRSLVATLTFMMTGALAVWAASRLGWTR